MTPRGMGRRSWATIRGRQNRRIIIITVCKVCNQPIETVGPLTAISQQWQIAHSEKEAMKIWQTILL